MKKQTLKKGRNVNKLNKTETMIMALLETREVVKFESAADGWRKVKAILSLEKKGLVEVVTRQQDSGTYQMARNFGRLGGSKRFTTLIITAKKA